MVDLNLRIKQIRKERNESGSTIVQVLHISPQYYYELEKGEKNLSIDIAKNLATYFSVSIDYLVGYDNN